MHFDTWYLHPLVVRIAYRDKGRRRGPTATGLIEFGGMAVDWRGFDLMYSTMSTRYDTLDVEKEGEALSISLGCPSCSAVVQADAREHGSQYADSMIELNSRFARYITGSMLIQSRLKMKYQVYLSILWALDLSCVFCHLGPTCHLSYQLLRIPSAHRIIPFHDQLPNHSPSWPMFDRPLFYILLRVP